VGELKEKSGNNNNNNIIRNNNPTYRAPECRKNSVACPADDAILLSYAIE